MTKQAIGYVRVSTEQQAKEGLSLEAQEKAIEDWCKFHGYELIATYIDAGISGKSLDNRPRLHAAIKALRKGMALVTYSLTRLSRSTKDLLKIKEDVEKAKADLVLLSEKLDTTTASGKVVFTILGAIGEFERDTASERTKHIKQHNKKIGKYNGGKLPYGFMLGQDKKTLIEVPHENELIARAKELRQANLPLMAIADTLKKEGFLNRRNKPFHAKQISRILGESKR